MYVLHDWTRIMASTSHHCYRNLEFQTLLYIRVMLYKMNLCFLHFRSHDCPHGFNTMLFVCLGIFPKLNFWLIWRRYYYQWRVANLTYAPHLWSSSSKGSLAYHTYCDASVYSGHLRGPVTLIPISERLTVELSLPVLTTVAPEIRITNLPLEGQTAL